MSLEVKMEHGCGSSFASDAVVEEDLENLSIPDLITKLRTAFLTVDFDRVEEALIKKEAKLKSENEELLRRNYMATLDRIEVEYKLEVCREECEEYKVVAEKGKIAQEAYEKLLKGVKKNGSEEKITIAELRTKVYKLKEEKCKAESMREILQGKVEDLTQRLSRIEDVEKLLSEEINARRNTEGEYRTDPMLHFKLKKGKEVVGVNIPGSDFGNNIADSSPSQRNGNGHLSGSSGGGRLGLEPVIIEVDSDDEDSTSVGTLQGKDAMAETHKRKLGSTSAWHELDKNLMDRLAENGESSSGTPPIDYGYCPIPPKWKPVNNPFAAITPAFHTDTTDKRRKTEAHSLGLNHSQR